ncbi:MAG: helix-turn-helix domain-containing protein [Bacteroidota bacterium]
MSILFLFGSLQALLLLIGVNIRNPFKGSKKQIISLQLFFTLSAMSYYVAVTLNWKELHDYVWILGNVSWMALLPCFYLLVKVLSEPQFIFKKIYLSYFFASFLVLIEGALIVLFDINIYRELYLTANYLNVWMFIFFFNSLFFSLKAAFFLRNQKKGSIRNSLIIVNSGFMLVLTVYGIIYLSLRENYALWFELTLICILTLLIYGFVFKIFLLAPWHKVLLEPKYQNLSTKGKTPNMLGLSIEKEVSENKLFLNPDLDLKELSNKTGIGLNRLSQYFNETLDSSFYEFINDKRLEYVEHLIDNESFKDYTIIGLALESGFKSKSTFYKAFKNKHNLTPSAYIKLKSKKNQA